MITEQDKNTIFKLAKKYKFSTIFLFGSAIKPSEESNDIDLGVKGIEPRLFFKFYAELFKQLSKPVNLIDLSTRSLFNDLVEENGVRIYSQ